MICQKKSKCKDVTGCCEGEQGSSKIVSINEKPVDTLTPEIGKWIKVIKPSRASLTYERME